jgi:hypothetical protein
VLLSHPGNMVEKLNPRRRYLSHSKGATEIGLTNADSEMIMIAL